MELSWAQLLKVAPNYNFPVFSLDLYNIPGYYIHKTKQMGVYI